MNKAQKLASVLVMASTLIPSIPVVHAQALPTASDVVNGLIGVYETQQVWPRGLIYAGSNAENKQIWISKQDYLPVPKWIGLPAVFPGANAASYPVLLGMTNVPQNQPITAGTLAQWLWNWELAARIPNQSWTNQWPAKTNIIYEKSYQNPYTVMNDYSMFYGTDFKNAQTLVTTHDLQMVEQNIKDVDQCYRMLTPNKIQLLMPLMINHNETASQQIELAKHFDQTIVSFTTPNKMAIADETGIVFSGLYHDSTNETGPATVISQTTTTEAAMPKHFRAWGGKRDASVPKKNYYDLSTVDNASYQLTPSYDFILANGRLSGVSVDANITPWPIDFAQRYC